MATLKSFACVLAALAAVGSAVPADHHQKRQQAPEAGFYVPSYYPAPYGGWVDDWKESYAKAKALVDRMTLAEKTNITGGTGIYMGRCNGNTGSALRVNFPQLCLNDAANGIRQTDNVTVFPNAITAGATFDKKLIYERGAAIGKEGRGKGVNIWLGPSVGPLGRKPKGGRNWEGFGSDPVLQGYGAYETIRGVQDQGVIATIKHLIGNEQEMYRMYNPFQYAYSANIDDRTLHEVYLWPFAEAVRAGVGAAMTAYNAVNGSASSHNPYLINGLLKDELGFQGFVMSDWISHMSGVASAIAGLDMDMPGDTQIPLFGSSFWMYELTRSTLNGSVPMDRLNDMATRIVAAWYKMGQDEGFPAVNFDTNSKTREAPLYPGAWPNSPTGVVNEFVQVQADHDVVARQVAQDGLTLLKNEDNLLPSPHRDPSSSSAPAQPPTPTAPTHAPIETVDYMYIDDPISAFRRRTDDVTFYNTDRFPSSARQQSEDDVAFVFITSDAGENSYTVEGNHGDRDASRLFAWHDGDRLVQDVAARYSNVVVVANTVGPLVLEAWHDLPSVKAVLIAHLPGQEGGESLTGVLYGDVSPNGHLPYSITFAEDDMPESVTRLIDSAFFNQPQDTYTEGLYIDYKWLNKAGIKARYAFGHGLSYTTFNYTATIEKVTQLTRTPPPRAPKEGILEYDQPIPAAAEAVAPAGFQMIWRLIYSWLSESDAQNAIRDGQTRQYPYPPGYTTTQREGPRAGGGEGGNPALYDTAYTLSVTVTNSGSEHSGKASVQAYLQFPEGIEYETPIIQLRDFEKTGELAPGESQTVQINLRRKDISVWDVVLQDWVVPEVDGAYKVWLGAASDDLSAVCHVDGLTCESNVAGPI
ncbi:putative beta-glucosidase 1 precursor [Stachybotrys elegans]|uniref:beta-glucosidase n=1 Tax=Stachybotrys elegans TaxID=80388 RepID=A0A8K0SUD6_9HYPO|nr:putative beta-glucosidase 1 precursor [Stachybotrys elegans]